MSTSRSTKKKGGKGGAVVLAEQDQGGEGDLNAMQQAFAAAYVDGKTAGNATKSAVAAGYSKRSAGPIGCALLKLPKIISVVDDALKDAISSRLTIKAVAIIETILDSKEASEKLKGDMALKIIEFSGLVARTQAAKAPDAGLGGKKLAEMSRSELEAIIAQGADVLKMAASLPAPGPLIEGKLSDKAPNEAPLLVGVSK